MEQSFVFPSAAECEAAFYKAIEKKDLEAMMRVWATDQNAACIHPSGIKVVGFEAIKNVWELIFLEDPLMQVRYEANVCWESALLAVRHVHETVMVLEEQEGVSSYYATNTFIWTPYGWRLLLHHACLASDESSMILALEEEDGGGLARQRILH